MATLVEIAAQLVAAQVSKTPMGTEELLAEIQKVHAALKKLDAGQPVEGVMGEEAKPALTVREAFKKNEVVCMVCGKGGFKTLARHLSTAHDMKPGAYKKQFGIPSKQSLSAKSYSEARKKMANERGLADNLAKAREVRMANIEAKKGAPAKLAKPGRPRKAVITGKLTPEWNVALVDSLNARLIAERSAKAPAKRGRKAAAKAEAPVMPMAMSTAPAAPTEPTKGTGRVIRRKKAAQ